jgi:hypothetical protein
MLVDRRLSSAAEFTRCPPLKFSTFAGALYRQLNNGDFPMAAFPKV